MIRGEKVKWGYGRGQALLEQRLKMSASGEGISVCVCVCVCVCNLTHSRVVVGQGFSQLTSSQKFAAHLQVVLDLNMSRPQDPCNIRQSLSPARNITAKKKAAEHVGA